jgi:hypothetical protein
MRIITILFLLISTISIGLISQEMYAECNINSQESASDYLKGCAGTAENAINPGQ